jgi:hypothetical protein
MKMEPVESSNIRAIGHDPKTLTMRVEFKNGGTYEYANVPAHAHADFMSSPSKGQHLLRNIREHFHGRRIS